MLSLPNVIVMDESQIRLLRMRWKCASSMPGAELTVILGDDPEPIVFQGDTAMTAWLNTFSANSPDNGRVPKHLKEVWSLAGFERVWIDPKDLMVAALPQGEQPIIKLRFKSARLGSEPVVLDISFDCGGSVPIDRRGEFAQTALATIAGFSRA